MDDLDRAVTALESARSEVAAARGVLRKRLRAQEDDLAGIETRIKTDEARLYSGSVTATRELQAMQAEIDSLKRRRGDLEEAVLVTMTELDPVEQSEADLLEQRAVLDADGSRLRLLLAEEESAIAELLATTRAQRSEAAGALAPDLTELYSKVRKAKGGIAVARLSSGRCGGCHLGLPAVEVARLRRLPPDELAYCEHCGRILVRDGEGSR